MTLAMARRAYCETRMVNKYLLPMPIDCVISEVGQGTADYSSLKDVLYILDAIERYVVPDEVCNKNVKTHDSLLRVLLSGMQRTTAIVWNTDIDKAVDAICVRVGMLRGNSKYNQASIAMFDKETISCLVCSI